MDGLEAALRMIHENNKQSRAVYDKLTARIVSEILTGTPESLNDLNRELEEQFNGLLEGTGEDTTVSGVNSSSGPPSESSGDQTQ
jgi:hypothetical protein